LKETRNISFRPSSAKITNRSNKKETNYYNFPDQNNSAQKCNFNKDIDRFIINNDIKNPDFKYNSENKPIKNYSYINSQIHNDNFSTNNNSYISENKQTQANNNINNNSFPKSFNNVTKIIQNDKKFSTIAIPPKPNSNIKRPSSGNPGLRSNNYSSYNSQAQKIQNSNNNNNSNISNFKINRDNSYTSDKGNQSINNTINLNSNDIIERNHKNELNAARIKLNNFYNERSSQKVSENNNSYLVNNSKMNNHINTVSNNIPITNNNYNNAYGKSQSNLNMNNNMIKIQNLNSDYSYNNNLYNRNPDNCHLNYFKKNEFLIQNNNNSTAPRNNINNQNRNMNYLNNNLKNNNNINHTRNILPKNIYNQNAIKPIDNFSFQNKNNMIESQQVKNIDFNEFDQFSPPNNPNYNINYRETEEKERVNILNNQKIFDSKLNYEHQRKNDANLLKNFADNLKNNLPSNYINNEIHPQNLEILDINKNHISNHENIKNIENLYKLKFNNNSNIDFIQKNNVNKFDYQKDTITRNETNLNKYNYINSNSSGRNNKDLDIHNKNTTGITKIIQEEEQKTISDYAFDNLRNNYISKVSNDISGQSYSYNKMNCNDLMNENNNNNFNSSPIPQIYSNKLNNFDKDNKENFNKNINYCGKSISSQDQQEKNDILNKMNPYNAYTKEIKNPDQYKLNENSKSFLIDKLNKMKINENRTFINNTNYTQNNLYQQNK